MAKSKSGGTRSYLRGRIASDVYSIGRDASGKKQQVVRSLAEQVKNPQTVSQMRGRMVMSTVMQAVSGLALLVDHSFDGKPAGQPSLSEFISRNYKLIAADVAAHPSAGNAFGLVKYQDKGIKGGAYVISNGEAILPAALSSIHTAEGELQIQKTAEDTTAKDIRDILGMQSEDFFTYVAILDNGTAEFVRFRVSNTLPDDTVIADGNVAQLFDVENPFNADISYAVAGAAIMITVSFGSVTSDGIIFSQKKEGGFIHSKTTLYNVLDPTFTADEALPTYPMGTERFLNGGDL